MIILHLLLHESTPKSLSSLIFNFFTPTPKGELVENQ
jgi:hypothetical protein